MIYEYICRTRYFARDSMQQCDLKKKNCSMRGIVPCWFSTRVFKLFFSSLFFLFYFVLFLLTKYARIAIFQSSPPPPSSCALWNDSRCLIKEQKIQTRVIEKFCRFSSRAENEKVFTLWYVSPFAGIRVTIFRSKNWLLLERVLYRERERERISFSNGNCVE